MENGRKSNGARRSRLVLAAAAAVFAGIAAAASDEEFREHGAHEHGHGALDIVVEGEELVAELRIPGVNVVGFEHVPRDDAERAAVREALVPFRSAASVLVPSEEAECEVEMAEADISSMAPDDHHEDEPGHDDEAHGHDDEAHGHEGDRHEEDEHDEEHDADHGHGDVQAKREQGEEHQEHEAHDEDGSDSGAEAHSELHAAYHFHCHAPERLTRIEVLVFEHLHDAEEIDVRVVTPAAQRAMTLHPGETVVELTP